MLELIARPLTAVAFTPFGDVIDPRTSDYFMINEGRTQRHHDLAQVQLLGDDARTLINIFVSQPVTMPLHIEGLERHPLGSQAFIPLHEERFIIVVAPPGPQPEPDQICAFVTDGRQGVNYHAGTWHAIHSVLDVQGEFLVIDRGGSGANCDEVRCPLQVCLP